MFNPVCLIETPFTEKFGTPRQSLLIPEAWGKLRFPKNDFNSEAFRGIENFSHLWIVFGFHLVSTSNALIRPPRFDGKMKWGVYATRSPHRPNQLGLSVVEFDRVEETRDEVILWVKGVDLVSGTPVYDVKPYLPYADSVPTATANYFEGPPVMQGVKWECEFSGSAKERILIEKVIGLDPRPGHDKARSEEFGVSVGGWNARFIFQDSQFIIRDISKTIQLKS